MANKRKTLEKVRERARAQVAHGAGHLEGEDEGLGSSFLPASLPSPSSSLYRDPIYLRKAAGRLLLFALGLAFSLTLPLAFMKVYTSLVDFTPRPSSSRTSPSGSLEILSGPVKQDDKAFLRWFSSIGGESPKVTLGHFPGEGRGLMATNAITEKDLLISVPMDWVICRETIVKTASPTDRAIYEAVREDEDALSLFLIKQLALGSQSPWWPYLKVLPSAVPVPLSFEAWELQAIQEEGEIDWARQERQRLEESFQSLESKLRVLLNDITQTTTKEAKVLHKDKLESSSEFGSLALFFWAKAVLSSRALTIRGDQFLVPFADMVNYKPDPQKRTSSNGERFLAYHKVHRQEFRVYADRNTALGEQHYEDYGDNDNYIYFRHHGFIAQNNPYDCVTIPLPLLTEEDPSSERKRALMERMRLMSPPYPCVNPNNEQPVHGAISEDAKRVSKLLSPASLLYLKVFFMDEEVLSRCGGSPSPENCERPGKQEQEILDWLAKAVEHRLREFPTTFQQDQELLKRWQESKSTQVSDGMKVAVQFRATRKKLLGEVLVKAAWENASLLEELMGVARLGEEEQEREVDTEESGLLMPSDQEQTSKSSTTEELHASLELFNRWVAEQKFPKNKLRVTAFQGMRLGTQAMEAIKQGELYLSVPLSAIMDSTSAHRCSTLGPVFAEISTMFGRRDPHQELLLHLIYEMFVKGKSSHWYPYLALLPKYSDLQVPLLFSKEEQELLVGSSVYQDLTFYREKLRYRYNSLWGNVLSLFPKVFSKEVFTLENYLYANIILDSRSIWWDGDRHLVPVLDMINCMEGPDPSQVHRTDLDPARQNAETKAAWDFSEGEQVFENYGQPNHIYFLYHGFTLEDNSHDCLQLLVSLTDEEAARHKPESLRLALRHLGFYSLQNTFCLSPESIPEKLLDFLFLKYDPDRVERNRRERSRLSYEKLLEVLEETRANYRVPLGEAIERLAQPRNLSGRELTVLKFIVQEQRLLEALIERLETKLGRTEMERQEKTEL